VDVSIEIRPDTTEFEESANSRDLVTGTQPRFVTQAEYKDLVKLVVEDKASRAELKVLADIIASRDHVRRLHERWLITVGVIFDAMVVVLAAREFLL